MQSFKSRTWLFSPSGAITSETKTGSSIAPAALLLSSAPTVAGEEEETCWGL